MIPPRYIVRLIEGSHPPTWQVTKIYGDARKQPEVFEVVDGDVANALAAHTDLLLAVEWALSADDGRTAKMLKADVAWQKLARAALAKARGEG